LRERKREREKKERERGEGRRREIERSVYRLKDVREERARCCLQSLSGHIVWGDNALAVIINS